MVGLRERGRTKEGQDTAMTSLRIAGGMVSQKDVYRMPGLRKGADFTRQKNAHEGN